MNSYYSVPELKQLGLKGYGSNVMISRKASIYGAENIEIGNNVRIDDFTILSGKIKTGNYIHIAPFTGLYGGKNGIELEDFVTLSSRIAIYAESDDYSGNSLTFPQMQPPFRFICGGRVLLKKYVIIGTGSTIMPSVTIGTGCAVGAMSFVKESLNDWGMYVGIPVRKIKERKTEIVLLEKEFHRKGKTDE